MANTPTAGNDILFGTNGADFIDAQAGDDFVYGGGGDDVINGGDGLNKLFGGDGNDLTVGEDTIDLRSITGMKFEDLLIQPDPSGNGVIITALDPTQFSGSIRIA